MNQLPDGMNFTESEETLFYTNTQLAYDKGFENVKEEMMESLRTDMEYMLNVLGIAVPENSSEDLDGPDSVIDWCGVYQYDDRNQGERMGGIYYESKSFHVFDYYCCIVTFCNRDRLACTLGYSFD